MFRLICPFTLDDYPEKRLICPFVGGYMSSATLIIKEEEEEEEEYNIYMLQEGEQLSLD
jgi:hypothetical protein